MSMPSPAEVPLGTLLVTGGSRGIGAAVVRQASTAGYDVAFTYVRERAAADALIAEIAAAGRRAIAIQADVGGEDDIVAAFLAVDDAFGPLTALVNNAGILGATGRVDAVDREMLERVFAVNVIGTLLCCREAVRRMSTAQGGSGGAIVNLSSRAADIGGGGIYVHYAASKGAIDSLTIGLANEVAAEGIRVNAVAPGLILTDIHVPGRLEKLAPTVPMKRAGTADEVAETILWLLSPASSYVTGAVLDVGGGR
jgi:NAD(P)-dependent dehydrogenase (short-subunit alcohol dehydrogenase family)